MKLFAVLSFLLFFSLVSCEPGLLGGILGSGGLVGSLLGGGGSGSKQTRRVPAESPAPAAATAAPHVINVNVQNIYHKQNDNKVNINNEIGSINNNVVNNDVKIKQDINNKAISNEYNNQEVNNRLVNNYGGAQPEPSAPRYTDGYEKE